MVELVIFHPCRSTFLEVGTKNDFSKLKIIGNEDVGIPVVIACYCSFKKFSCQGSEAWNVEEG